MTVHMPVHFSTHMPIHRYVSIVNKALALHPKPGVRQMYFALPDFLAGNETRKREALEAVAALVAERRIQPFVQATYKLESVPAALAAAAAGHIKSKIAVSTVAPL